MMRNVDFHAQIKETLRPFAKENEFTLKGKYQLHKKIKDKSYTQIILSGTSSYGENHYLGHPIADVRFEEIERYLEPFDDSLFGGNNFHNPLVASIFLKAYYENPPKKIWGRGADEKLSVRAKDPETLGLCLDLWIKTGTEKVLPFFEEVNCLEGFDSYLENLGWIENTQIGNSGTNTFTMTKWLLVKKLIKSPNYNQLKEVII